MIELMFELGNEIVLVMIRGTTVLFGNTSFGKQLADISGLKLNYAGVVREFPDLELRNDWREEAIKRFKDKICSMDNEEEISKYIIEELKKSGYKPKAKRRDGFRPIKL
jgi:hypothetical protein